MPVADDGLLAVARVAGAHGLRGALRLRPHGGQTTSLVAGRAVTLRRDGEVSRHTIARVVPHGSGQLLVELDGVGDRTQAEAFAGSSVLVAVAELPAPGAWEFYWHEMPGYRVETVDGQPVGVITDTMHTGTTDVWAVDTPAGERLIPVIRDVVATIDRAERRVLITPMPGLLD
ncbi:MAG TPA: ribosome maturation factor RimM [Candidatus Limnocylindria bacterium]|nr:ribosome maturation factor RimM [Candidatus Limnocylindria bacterium]